MVWRSTTVLMALALISEVSVHDYNSDNRLSSFNGDEGVPNFTPFLGTMADEEYIRHIHSLFDAYKGDIGGRLVVETNALINTKYRTWKRNADLINSLLALPKGMNDAGR